MDTKTAIIIGVWIFAAAAWFSKDISNFGKWIAFVSAIAISIFLKQEMNNES